MSANNKGDMTVRQAVQKGGQVTSDTYSHKQHYESISKKSGGYLKAF